MTLEERVAAIESLLAETTDADLTGMLQPASWTWLSSSLPTTGSHMVIQFYCQRVGDRLEVALLVNGFRTWVRNIGLKP